MASIPSVPTLQANPAVTASGQQLWVGPNSQYAFIHDALAAAQPGATIFVEAGTYDLANYNLGHGGRGQVQIDFDVRLIGVGGMVKLTSSNLVEKGFLKTQPGVSLYVENFEFVGADSSSNNGAGIRHQGKDLTVLNSIFTGNENGILATGSATSNVYISGTEFSGNGYPDGRSHGIYINQADNLVVVDSQFYDQVVGHHIKSMAASNTWVVNTILDDAGGTSSYAIDVTRGGNLYVTGSTITQDATSQNPTIVNYTTARGGYSGEVIFENNVITNNHPSGNFLRNQTDAIPEITNNNFIDGPGSSLKITSTSIQVGNTFNGIAGQNTTPSAGAVTGTAGNDTMVGTDLDDRIDGLGGDDVIFGGSGVGKGNDSLFGGDGNDSLFGGKGNDYLSGGNGNDYLEGGGKDNTLVGDAGDDTLVSLTKSRNTMFGGDGNDVIYGNEWKDAINGGAGFDVAVYHNKFSDYTVSGSAAARMRVDAVSGANDSGRDDIFGIEALQFSDGVYWTQTQVFEAGKVLVDIASILAGNPAGTIVPSQPTIPSGTGGTTTNTNTTNNSDPDPTTISNNGPNDELNSENDGEPNSETDDQEQAASGSGESEEESDDVPFISAQEISSRDVENNGADDNYTRPTVGNYKDNSLVGNDGNNILIGNDGDNILKGRWGKDTLMGGDGDDRLYGHGKDDVLTGGAGADTFIFNRTRTGHDVVTDFESGIDTISISRNIAGNGIRTVQDVLDSASQIGNDTIIDLGGDNKIELMGVKIDDLDSSSIDII